VVEIPEADVEREEKIGGVACWKAGSWLGAKKLEVLLGGLECCTREDLF
jgi:hypothetical protein